MLRPLGYAMVWAGEGGHRVGDHILRGVESMSDVSLFQYPRDIILIFAQSSFSDPLANIRAGGGPGMVGQNIGVKQLGEEGHVLEVSMKCRPIYNHGEQEQDVTDDAAGTSSDQH